MIRAARSLLLALVAPLLVAVTGCSSSGPPAVGVVRVGRVVEVAYKPCDDQRAQAGIGRLELFRSDRPDQPVWTARHRSGGTAVLELPFVSRFPGYDIVDRRTGNTFDPDVTYTFEAAALDGVAWRGATFRYDDLGNGRVQANGEDLDFATWIDAPPTCSTGPLDLSWPHGLLVVGIVALVVVGSTMAIRRRRAPT